jgi:hypothetical protein
MEETPTISNVSVKLFGVKTTLNRLAVKLELSWQVLRDFDSINRIAEAPENSERRDVRNTKGESINEDLMMVIVSRKMPSRREGKRLLSRDFQLDREVW